MRAAVRILCYATLVLWPVAAFAQAGPAPGPPGPYVVDVHGVMSSLPQDSSFFPPAPTSSLIPTRGMGFDIGGHVYLIGLGPARIGLGASFGRVKGAATVQVPTSSTPSTGPPPPSTRPDIDTTVRFLTPQLSLNFGSARGWSFVSVGVGQTSVRTGTSPFALSSSATAPLTPARTLQTAALQTINVGGGARWFRTEHLAFSFDVRFHKVAARAKEGVRTPAMTLITAAAGISLK